MTTTPEYKGWIQVVFAEQDNSKILECPRNRPALAELMFYQFNNAYVSYACNGNLLGALQYVDTPNYIRNTAVKDPSGTVVLADINPDAKRFDTTYSYQKSFFADSQVNPQMPATLRVGYIHNKNANGLWADGHVEMKARFLEKELTLELD